MKKLLIIPALLFALLASAQSDCLQTSCVATHAKVGDTVQIGAVLTTSNGVSSLICTQVSGPNTASQILTTGNWKTSLQDTARVNVTGLAVGTYVFQFVGKDVSGGGTPPGYDTIVVSAATACPVVPAPRTVTAAQIQIGGIWFTLPAGTLKITYSDGTTGNY